MKHLSAATAMIVAPLLLASNAPAGDLVVELQRVRNDRGTLHLCLMRDESHFPDCGKDPRAIRRSVPAATADPVRFTGLAPGGYALSVLHDENGNGRLDTFLGIPKEGFGFSRNPAVGFGPPEFGRARFEIGRGITRQVVRMQYLL